MLWIIPGFLLATIPPVAPDVPNRQPQLAASGSAVAMVFGSGKSIRFAKSEDSGATFSRPVTIAELSILALGRHRGPRVVFAGTTILVSAIGGTTAATGPHAHGLPSDGDLFVWRSTDGGATWTQPTTINDVPGSAREGLHAFSAEPQGHVAAVWLDLRAKGTRLYGALSKDFGATWSNNFQVYESPDGSICECCHPSLLAVGSGEFAAMFRNFLDGNRDMYVVPLRAGKSAASAQKAGTGSWPLKACPMDGGGLTLSKGRTLTAWRREKEVFLAVPGQPETRIGEGKDVTLTAQGDDVYAVWVEGGVIRSWVNGRPGSLSQTGSFPAITALPTGGALVAWEADGAIVVDRLPAP